MRNLVLFTFFIGLSVFSYGQSADYLNVLNTQLTNEIPSFYAHEFKVEFKRRSVVGAPGSGTYSGLFTLAPWTNTDNTGGYNYQLNFNGGGIYYRKALPLDASWGDWMQFIMANSNGYVGIGHAAPLSALHIKGTNNLTSEIRLDNAASNASWAITSMYNSDRLGFRAINAGYTEVLSILANGKVGIGTTNPADPLHVFEPSGGNGTTLRLDAATDMNPNLMLSINGQNAANIRFRESANNLEFQVGSSLSTAMVISNNTTVGIGTTSPSRKLEVQTIDSWNLPPLRIGSSSGNEPAVDFKSGTATFSIAVNNGTNDAFKLYHGAPDNSLVVRDNGNVGIGTTNPGTYKLAVEGKIGARSVKVTTASWADYVFASDYTLMSLPETEAYIKKNQHLPNIPSAAEVKANGFHLEEMDAKLLAKIEELTLHIIRQEKQLKAQEERMNRQEVIIEELRKQVKP